VGPRVRDSRRVRRHGFRLRRTRLDSPSAGLRASALGSQRGCRAALLLAAEPARAGAPRVHEEPGFDLFESPQADPIVVSADGGLLFVADTIANRVEVFDTALRLPVASVPVGVEPVALGGSSGSPTTSPTR
jgi:hypothetical protein